MSKLQFRRETLFDGFIAQYGTQNHGGRRLQRIIRKDWNYKQNHLYENLSVVSNNISRFSIERNKNGR